jgi:hypothetical protein
MGPVQRATVRALVLPIMLAACVHASPAGRIDGTLVADMVIRAPTRGTVVVLDTAGKQVKTVATAENGTFSVRLSPGSYLVGGKLYEPGVCQPRPVTVRTDTVVSLVVTGPPGIGCGP